MKYDIGIVDGRIVDGTGNPWFPGDVAISGGVISKIGRVPKGECEQVVDAKGCFVCPGFVDIHTHSDIDILKHPACGSTIRQGVTTHVAGNCGDSAAPIGEVREDLQRAYMEIPDRFRWRSFGEYLDALEDVPIAHNIASLVGHGTVRAAVMGWEQRAPEAEELERMKVHVEEAMDAGAFGLSTGLVYPPGCFAETDEIVELCRVAAGYEGLYASHIRGERETILDAIREAIEIGRRSGARVQISHNCPKIGASGRTKETLELVERARAEGLDVTIDNDVHTDFGPRLSQALPQYLHELSRETLIALVRDDEARNRIRREIVEDKLPAPGYGGLLKHGLFNRIFLLKVPGDEALEGKTISCVAEERGRNAFDTYFDLLVETGDRAVALFDYIDEDDVRALIVHPLMMFCSDGSVRSVDAPTDERECYEPCSYGEYPGILERYVREEGLLTIQEAVRKMTSFPAQKMGLFDRGLMRPGMNADVVVVDLEHVKDRATNRWPHGYPFENYPHQYPEGIPFVIVNGELAVENCEQTDARAGRVLRHRPKECA